MDYEFEYLKHTKHTVPLNRIPTGYITTMFCSKGSSPKLIKFSWNIKIRPGNVFYVLSELLRSDKLTYLQCKQFILLLLPDRDDH